MTNFKVPFKNLLALFGLIALMSSCSGAKVSKSATVKLKFLDEYIIPKDFEVDGTIVGGLSDLDYDGEHFYAVVDRPGTPYIYEFSMPLKGSTIDTLLFEKTIKIKNEEDPYKKLVFDSEGLNYNPSSQTFTLSSEGAINKEKDPFIVDIAKDGTILDFYQLPEYFLASNKEGLRSNGAFEGLSRSVDSNGFWMATELPMLSDGPTVKLYNTKSPVRFTYFDNKTKEAQQQFAYSLGRLRKVPLLPFGINGVSGILEIAPKQFLVIERGYSAGHGSHGNRIMIYLADASKATNILKEPRLKSKIGKTVVPAEKKLIFDFKKIRKKLKHRFADNIEGLVLGPKLPNGNHSLVLISDNNFNTYDEQINQVILMELIME